MLHHPKTHTPQLQRSFLQTNRPAVDRRVLSWLPSPQELRRPIEAVVIEALSEADTQHAFLALSTPAPSLETLASREMAKCDSNDALTTFGSDLANS